jgi:hypothetical protein
MPAVEQSPCGLDFDASCVCVANEEAFEDVLIVALVSLANPHSTIAPYLDLEVETAA